LQQTFHQRHLGSVVLNITSSAADILQLVPNTNQPRMRPKDDPELRRSILENGGLLEPILVEPHPEHDGKFRIIDGERRWYNCKTLVEVEKRDEFRKIPIELTDCTLTDEDRLRAWVTIHMQRKEWSAKEKERTAHKLIQLVGRIKAANILGVTVREVDRLCETFELSEKMSELRNPDASITYAREIMSLPKYIRTKEVEDEIVRRVNDGQIKSSKHIRELRAVLKEPSANNLFLVAKASAEEYKRALSGKLQEGKRSSLADEIERFNRVIVNYPWTSFEELRTKDNLVTKIRTCRDILGKMERLLSRTEET
jgi:ParB family chromosome partitioning protein